MPGILTIAGETKLAASVGGTALNLTTIRIGDGNGGPITPLRTMTDLVRRVGVALPITASARDATTPTMWRVTTEIPADSGPFTLREIAVFDAAGDMIAIASHPAVEFLGAGGDAVEIVTDIVFPVSGNANVTVQITPSTMMPLHRNTTPYFMSVNSGVLTAPPANPAVGDTYAIPAAPTGAWAGMAGNLMQWWDGGWQATVPPLHHIVANRAAPISAPNAFLRKAAGGWENATASAIAYGLTTFSTSEEVRAGVVTNKAIDPAALAAVNQGGGLAVTRNAAFNIPTNTFSTMPFDATVTASPHITWAGGVGTVVNGGWFALAAGIGGTKLNDAGFPMNGQKVLEIRRTRSGSALSRRVVDEASDAWGVFGTAYLALEAGDVLDLLVFFSQGATVAVGSSQRVYLDAVRVAPL